MKRIPLTQGNFALVDDADFEYLMQWKWYAKETPHTFYAVRTVYLGGGRDNRRNKRLWMHRLIMKAPDGLFTDHIDGDGLNNQRSNLRLCTAKDNSRNRRINLHKSMRYKGVYWNKRDKIWYSRIYVDNTLIYLGTFETLIGAVEIYNKAAKKYFGEFAKLNNV